MNIKRATKTDFKLIMQIWETAVKATHDFLSDEDFVFFKTAIPRDYLPNLSVYILEDEGEAKAFCSVSEENLEMLFVDAKTRGKGYGKVLIKFVVEELKIYNVDVNEQNQQAVGFYEKMAYRKTGRSEKDSLGKAYPILHYRYVRETAII